MISKWSIYLNQNQKAKTKFRATKKWKDFRHKIYIKQGGKDYITQSKLRKYSALHHCDLDQNHYEDLSNEDNFYYLNNGCHDTVHYLFTYYKKDQTVLDRLQEVLDKMLEVNGL